MIFTILLASILLSPLNKADINAVPIIIINMEHISIANPVIKPKAEESMFCKNVLVIKIKIKFIFVNVVIIL